MRHKRFLLVLLLTLVVSSVVSPMHLSAATKGVGLESNGITNDVKDIYDDKGWNLVWQDEFDGEGKPDPSKWGTSCQERHGNENGPDMYWQDDMVSLNGKGQLSIKINKVANKNNDNDQYDLASGMIRTRNKYEKRFGKFEIRCKLPKQQGWWVAFWLMSDSVKNVDGSGRDGTEIDIMEAFGWNNKVNHALHWDGYGDYHKGDGKLSFIENHDAYHTYSLVWTPTEYRYYIDGKLTWVTSNGGVSQVPQYLKISGESTTKPLLSNDTWARHPQYAQYPDEFLVDYVRVYDYDFGVAKLPEKKKTPFVVKGVKPSKDTYRLGEEVKWQTDVQGDDIKYQYYVSRKLKLLDRTKYAPNDTYSFTPKEPGYYKVIAYAYDGNEIKQIGESQIKVVDKEIKLKDIKTKSNKNSITWEVDAEGDNLNYSFYIVKNGREIKYVPYNSRKTVTLHTKQDGIYDVIAYVQDEFGNTIEKRSKKLGFRHRRSPY